MHAVGDRQGGTDEATIIRRRGLLKAGAALSTLAVAPTAARAQPKIAPPNIIKAGTLVMSINPTLPPLQFVDDKGELQGMRVELANEIAKRLGLTPEYIRTEFATMIPGLAAKRWDMINTGIFFTEERSKLMYMVPYEQAAISFLAAKGNPLGLKTVDDLAGKQISVELGGIEERRTREVAKMVAGQGPEADHGDDLQQLRRGLPGAEGRPVGRRDLDRRHGDVHAAARRLHPRDLGRVPADRLLRLRQQDAGRSRGRRAERPQEGRLLRQAARPVRRAEDRRRDLRHQRVPGPGDAPASRR